MAAKLINKVHEFLKDNKIDYLLVASTNEFLMEYTPLEENSRYLLTGFSGSVGDALVSKNDIFLFVDGRYHEQADSEVDKALVKVIKMKTGEIFSDKISEKISPNSTLGLIAKKTSQSLFEILEKKLKTKKVKIKLLDVDPVKDGTESREKRPERISIEFTGLSSEEKIKKIKQKLKPDEAILVSSLEEISYLLNIRDFSKNYNSSTRHKPELISKTDKPKKIYADKTSTNAKVWASLGEKAAELKENPVKHMKALKTKEEIRHLKECFEKTDKALLATRDFIENNENISEFEIAQKLEENFYKYGAKSISFKSIVAKDKNSALAHYSKNSKSEILKNGSLILIDCGAYYEGGLATDITRVFVKGKPTQIQKQVYTCVLKALLKAFRKKITQKTSGFDIDKSARKLLGEISPQGFNFSHSLGHGIGISVHENPPSLSPSALGKTKLEQNMCFTIEPGLYNPKHFGVRLENSCYLTSKGIKSFTQMPFEEKLIDFEMLTPIEKRQLKTFKVK